MSRRASGSPVEPPGPAGRGPARLAPSRLARLGAAAVVALALGPTGCAHVRPPAPALVAAAQALPSYSATLRVGLRGGALRGRGRVLLAFARPDSLRVEVPGPGGLRLLAVAQGDRLWAVFPGEGAWFEGAAGPEHMQALLGLSLAPAEVMDLLVGRPAARLRAFEARWDGALPRRIAATLADGSRLSVQVEQADAPASLPAAAFTEPPHPGYRRLDADEVRALWERR